MNVFVTGGAGFIGSNFIRYLLNSFPDYRVINYDALTYAGNLDNLNEISEHPNYHFIKGDVRDYPLVLRMLEEHNIDVIVNFAAESHVDRSISNPGVFVETNVLGTQSLLEAARLINIKKFVQISTDEVYGSLGNEGFFTEESPIAPNSPYAASKASADLMVRAYHETYDMNVNITRCSNNYGPYHHPEKLIPLMITKSLEEMKLPVYGDGLNIRDWLHVRDHCRAIDQVIHKGKSGEVYNIGGHNEWTNIAIVEKILTELGKSQSLIHFVKDRQGHDRRYAIDSAKIRNELNWIPEYSFENGLMDTIKWYKKNRIWWQKIKKLQTL